VVWNVNGIGIWDVTVSMVYRRVRSVVQCGKRGVIGYDGNRLWNVLVMVGNVGRNKYER
jgi:hypothetical protein